MYIHNLKLATVFRVLLVAVCLYGLVAIFSVSGFSGQELLSFYTIDSNIAVLAFFSWLLFYTWRRPKQELPSWCLTVKGAVMFGIVLTFLVYHFILSPTLFSVSDGQWAFAQSPMNIALHYIVPLMTLVDWLLFDKKGNFKRWMPLVWLAIPSVHLVFVLIRAQFSTFSLTGSHYPYFFIDIDTYGIGQVALNVLGLAVCLIILGYIFYLIDWALTKQNFIKFFKRQHR
ncbi:MAG: Pr6Pr family membrane protein [Candidatus Nomurabacteria bacterium]|jgi:hypothetical protein|nr:Pr6Pr family membrane protein [Candidatus Nomurabacteria bacterium]